MTKRKRKVSSAEAEASSAHSRINIPLNLENWKALGDDLQQDLLWFHQHLLDNKMGWQDSVDAIDYDRSTIFKILKGTYEGSWKNVLAKIRSYKRLADQRGHIKQNEVVDNSIVRLVGGALDYALANHSITMICGESRMGKSEAALKWRAEHNHGRSVYFVAPAAGGNKMFLRRIAEQVGVNKNLPFPDMYDAVVRAFNPNRMLICDEAHRTMPSDGRSNACRLEILRDIHDATQCGLAILMTARYTHKFKNMRYQIEQFIGRIGMPVLVPPKIKDGDFLPIVKQYIARPSNDMIETCRRIANDPGRLGILVETLKFASRIASKDKQSIKEDHFVKAVAIRDKMMGDGKDMLDEHTGTTE